jgi:hypothetical protein
MNTKQDIRDAAHQLRELIRSGADNIGVDLAALCDALCGEMDRQLEFDAKRATATQPSSTPAATTGQ